MTSKRILALSITSAMVLAACQQPAPVAPVVIGAPSVTVTAGPSVVAGTNGTVTAVVNAGTNGTVQSVSATGGSCSLTSGTTYTCTVPVPTSTTAGNFPVTVTVVNNGAAGSNTNSAITSIPFTAATTPPVNPPVNNGTASITVFPILPLVGTQTSTTLQVNAVAAAGKTVKSITVLFNGVTTVYSVANGGVPAGQSSYGGIYLLNAPLNVTDGSYPVLVTMNDSMDAPISAATNLTIARLVAPQPPVVTPVPDEFLGRLAVRPVRGSFGPSNPRIGLEDQTGLAGGGTGALSDPRDVVRVLAQAGGDTPAGQPSSQAKLTYAKGFIKFAVQPTFAAADVDHVDYKIVETPDGAAIDYLDDTGNAANGFESAGYDTSNHNDLEGKPLYVVALVVYKTGAEETFIRPFYVDRTAPQAPDPEVKGAPVVQYTASNFLEDVFNVEDNWARGTVFNYITNSDLKDLPGNVGDGKAPSGLENITYYYVPVTPVFGARPFVCEDANGQPVLSASQCAGAPTGGQPQVFPRQIFVTSPSDTGPVQVPLRGAAPVVSYTLPSSVNVVGDAARAAAIRRAAVNPTTTPSTSVATNALTEESRGTSSFAYRTIVGSGASVPIGNAPAQDYVIALDNAFAVFAISRDRLGNSRPSTSYKIVSFDNRGPVIVSGGVVDTSPLPYPAQPGYVSDQGRISGLTLSDSSNNTAFAGIGFANGSAGVIGLGGFAFPITSPFLGANLIGPFRFDFDSNQIADGAYTLGSGGVGGFLANDLLGNPAQPFVGGPTVTIDNVDPGLDFTSPLPGQTFNAYANVNIQTTPTDATAGLDFTSVYWNDYIADESGGVPVAQQRTRDNGFVGAPVEIARGLDAYGNLSNGSNVRWNALYPGFDTSRGFGTLTGIQPMKLNAMAVDKAGNATLRELTINVSPIAGTAPSCGPLELGLGNCPDPVANNVTDLTPGSIPSIGQMDVHNFTTPANYHFLGFGQRRQGYTSANLIPQSPAVPETLVYENQAQYTAEVRVPGTTPDLNPDAVADIVDAEGVKFHRQLGIANWARVKLWQTTFDPTLDRDADLRNKRLFEWTRVDQDFIGTFSALIPYYNSASPEFQKVTNSLDAAYAFGNSLATNGNGEGSTSTVAPWPLFDNTVTSSTLHKVQSRFDTQPYNAPSVVRSNTNYVVATGFAGMVTPIVPGNVRLYNYLVRNPSTTAVAVVVKDNVGNYNFSFEGLDYSTAGYSLTGPSARVDGVKPSPLNSAAPADTDTFLYGGDQ